MAEDSGIDARAGRLVGRMQVRLANACGYDLDQDLVGGHGAEADVLQV